MEGPLTVLRTALIAIGAYALMSETPESNISLTDQAHLLVEKESNLGLCERCRHEQPTRPDAIKDKCLACGEYTVNSAVETIRRISL